MPGRDNGSRTPRGRHDVALARQAPACGNTAPRDTARPPQDGRDTPRDAFHLRKHSQRDTRRDSRAAGGTHHRALGTGTEGGPVGPAHAVVMRPVRETARPAPHLHVQPERTCLAVETRLVVHMRHLRETRIEPACAHLHRHHRLPQAEGGRETPSAGRAAETQTACRRCQAQGTGEGTPPPGCRAAESPPQGAAGETPQDRRTPVARPAAARPGRLQRPRLCPLPMQDLPAGPGSRPRRRPLRGICRRLRGRRISSRNLAVRTP